MTTTAFANPGRNAIVSLSRDKIFSGSLILVNRKHRYREQPHKALVPVYEGSPSVLMERRACVLLSNLMAQIHGWQGIVPVSGWRSYKEQQDIWNSSLKENGADFTCKYVALPGHSEHQTGLAIDLGLKKEAIDFIRPDFPYHGICGIFREKAADFGFVERYPKDREQVTGIGHEPWHFRYVGVPHAAIMMKEQLTLEEYTDFLKQFPYGGRPYCHVMGSQQVTVSFLMAADEEMTNAVLDGNRPYSVSGNNVDGFIITEWRGAYAQKNCLRRA